MSPTDVLSKGMTMDSDAGSTEAAKPEQAPTPPPEAVNEVLQDEIESIKAIGEDQ